MKKTIEVRDFRDLVLGTIVRSVQESSKHHWVWIAGNRHVLIDPHGECYVHTDHIPHDLKEI